MIAIRKATVNDIELIQSVAKITWPITYGKILSKEQLYYMIDLIYSKSALEQQLGLQKQLFYIINIDDLNLGFVSLEHNYQSQAITRIHKLYLLPESQGKGIGKLVLDFVELEAKKMLSIKVSLNVNRFNPALFFYNKNGFKNVAEENISIGNGYLMEDFVLEKEL